MVEELAELGALVVTEGAAAPLIITTHDATGHELVPGPEFTQEDRQVADNVFVTQETRPAMSIPATLLVVGASVATLKSIAIDEQKSHERRLDEEEEADAVEQKNRAKPKGIK
jgi:hypothetical protein